MTHKLEDYYNSLGNRCRYKSKGTIPIWISVFKWIVHCITVSIVTLGIVRGLDIWISTEKSSNLWANGKMQYNPGWESGSMKTLAAHGLAGGIVQDRMGGSFGAVGIEKISSEFKGSRATSKSCAVPLFKTALFWLGNAPTFCT
jgi:hypothetical protein